MGEGGMMPRARPKTIPIKFPIGGLTENHPYHEQMPGTTPECLNVVAYDPEEDRARGGQRDGLSKYIEDALGATRVQNLSQITRVLDTRTVVKGRLLFEEPFTGTDGDTIDTVLGADWDEMGDNVSTSSFPADWKTTADDVSLNRRWEFSSNQATVDFSGTGNDDTRGLRKRGADFFFTDEDAFILRCAITTFSGGETTDNARYWAGVSFRIEEAGDGESFFCGWNRDAGATTTRIQLIKRDGASETTLETTSTTTEDDEQHILEVRVNRHFVQVYWDEVFQFSHDLSGNGFDASGNKQVGIVMGRDRDANAWSSSDSALFDDFQIYEGVNPSNPRDIVLVAVEGGDVKVGNHNDGMAAPTTGGTDEFYSGDVSNEVNASVAFQKLYMVDGFDYKVYDPSDGSVADWDATSTATLPGGNGPEGANGDGTADGNDRCRIIATYRGRVVLAGKRDDPHNWFMGAVGDPLDWDSSTDVGGAVSGNNADFGKIGDIVTALIPYFDDQLLFGGDHTITVLNGDPKEGGTIGYLSNEVGIAGPRAWCYGPERQVYFFGTNGLYEVTPNQFNITFNDRISAGRLDNTFRDIDFATHRVQLAYDLRRHGVHIFITPTFDATTTTHYFWSRRNNAFWPIEYPKDIGPTSVLVFDADDPLDRAILLGGFDGRIRQVDETKKDDDGMRIRSHCYIGPIYRPFGAGTEFRITRTNIVMDEQSDPADMQIRVADTAEAALDAQPAAAWRAGFGRNDSINNKVRGTAGFLRIGNMRFAEWWTMEGGEMTLVPGGRARNRADTSNLLPTGIAQGRGSAGATHRTGPDDMDDDDDGGGLPLDHEMTGGNIDPQGDDPDDDFGDLDFTDNPAHNESDAFPTDHATQSPLTVSDT